jgi:hypothetical protein
MGLPSVYQALYLSPVYVWWWWASKTRLKTMLVVRDTLASRSHAIYDVLSEVTPESPVTATVPGKVVVLRIKRLLQHHMLSGNVWGGSKLVSRSCYVNFNELRSLEHSRHIRQGSRM